MKVVALCSGGKDSCYALFLAMELGNEVTQLIAMMPEREDSWMYHRPNTRLVDLLAECADLPLIKAETSGEKERELEDLRRVLEGLDVDGVVSGAIASTYQKSRIDRICDGLGLASIAPLWGREPLDLMREMIGAGFEAIITSVAALGFDEGWLGRKIDDACLEDLKKLRERFGISVCGEGGEYETLVVDAPFFKSRIAISEARRDWDRSSCRGILKISKARLAPKK